MKNIILFDREDAHKNLLPLSYTRPIADFRIGILTIRDKWRFLIPDCITGVRTVGYLRDKFPSTQSDSAIFIDSTLIPDRHLAQCVESLSDGEALIYEDSPIAFKGSTLDFENGDFSIRTPYMSQLRRIEYVFNIFQLNGEEIRTDFRLLTINRKSMPIPDSCSLIGSGDGESIFIEEGAVLTACTLNTTGGPIYVGKNAEIMEGSCLRGPISIGDNSKVNMGSKIYPDTTIGPWSKVGGELNNTVIFGYSNKAHDGFLGNAVIGEWCNIGAGTNASNLKNDYSKIRIWNYATHAFMKTDLQFCGLIMGDHSKAGINCMFNTASVVGVGVNFHGSGFPRPFIPSFSKGSCAGFTDVCLKNFFDVAGKAMARRGVELTEVDHRMFEKIFEEASRFKQ